MNERRLDALDAVLRSLRTGEFTAAQEARAAFAPTVVYRSGANEFAGVDAVLERLNGQWPLTPVYAQGEWSEPELVGESARVSATFPTFGTIRAYALTVTFDGADRITLLDETVTMYPSPAPSSHIPPVVRTAINGALANGTPLVVAYTGGDGIPALSLRGSVQVYGKSELCLWVRNPKSGLVDAVRKGQVLSLLYRNSGRRMTLVMRGRGEISRRRGPRADLVAFAGGREAPRSQPERGRRARPDRAAAGERTGRTGSRGGAGLNGAAGSPGAGWLCGAHGRGPRVGPGDRPQTRRDRERSAPPGVANRAVARGAPARTLVAPRARRPRASPDRPRPRHRSACRRRTARSAGARASPARSANSRAACPRTWRERSSAAAVSSPGRSGRAEARLRSLAASASPEAGASEAASTTAAGWR